MLEGCPTSHGDELSIRSGVFSGASSGFLFFGSVLFCVMIATGELSGVGDCSEVSMSREKLARDSALASIERITMSTLPDLVTSSEAMLDGTKFLSIGTGTDDACKDVEGSSRWVSGVRPTILASLKTSGWQGRRWLVISFQKYFTSRIERAPSSRSLVAH